MKFVRVGQVRLAVLDKGRGQPLVLIHGFPLDHSMWDSQIERFSRTHRVIAPDLRCCGQSDVTPGTVTMEQLADDVAALLDELGVSEPVVFCGLSMGGYVAWQFWRKYSQKLRALVLCDTKSQADSPEAAASRKKMLSHVLNAGTGYIAEAMLPKLFAPQTLEYHAAIVDGVREKLLAASPEGIAAVLRGLLAREDFSAALPRISLPALLVVGEHDAISPVDEMKAMAAAMPNARLEIIAAAGHLPPLENPTAFNAAIEQFLAGLE